MCVCVFCEPNRKNVQKEEEEKDVENLFDRSSGDVRGKEQEWSHFWLWFLFVCWFFFLFLHKCHGHKQTQIIYFFCFFRANENESKALCWPWQVGLYKNITGIARMKICKITEIRPEIHSDLRLLRAKSDHGNTIFATWCEEHFHRNCLWGNKKNPMWKVRLGSTSPFHLLVHSTVFSTNWDGKRLNMKMLYWISVNWRVFPEWYLFSSCDYWQLYFRATRYNNVVTWQTVDKLTCKIFFFVIIAFYRHAIIVIEPITNMIILLSVQLSLFF